MARVDFVAITLVVFATIQGLSDAQATACTYMEATNCASPMSDLATEKNISNVCPVLETAKKCLERLLPMCADGVLIYAQDKLREATGAISSVCEGECTYPALAECLKPMEHFTIQTPLSESCPVMKEAKKCMLGMKPCTDPTISFVLDDQVRGLDVYLPYCQEGTTIDPWHHETPYPEQTRPAPVHTAETYECSWTTVSMCIGGMAGFNEKTPPSESCPVMRSAKECLLKISECSDETIKTTIKNTLDGMDLTLPLCPIDGQVGNSTAMGCDMMSLKKCHDPLTPMAEMDGENFNLTKLCPLVHDGNDCYMKLETLCADNEVEVITKAIEGAKMGLDAMKMYCPRDGQDGNSIAKGCDVLSLKKCTDPLAPMGQMTAENFDMTKICPLVHDGNDCFMKLEKACEDNPVEFITKTMETTMVGLDAMKPYCPRVGSTTPGFTWPPHESTGGNRYPTTTGVEGVTRPQHESTRYPTTTDGDAIHCKWSKYYVCTDPLNKMQGDQLRMCKTWWESKQCMTSLQHICDYGGAIRTMIDSDMDSWERKMDHCRAHCDGERIHDCLRETKEGHDFEDQCRESGKAKQCLRDLKEHCQQHHDVSQWIEHHDMPWLEEHMEKCMTYGHETGSGSYTGDDDKDRWKNQGSTGSRDLTSTLAFVTTMAVTLGMFSIRF